MSSIPRLALVGATLALGLPAAASAETGPTITAHVELRGGGTVVRSYDCTWVGAPTDPDCSAIVGDAPAEIALIKRNGAESTTVRVRSSDGRHSTTRSLSQRKDGTWLFEGTNHVIGSSFGFVCDSAGVSCVPWKTGPATARGARPSSSAVKAEKRAAISRAKKKLRAAR